MTPLRSLIGNILLPERPARPRAILKARAARVPTVQQVLEPVSMETQIASHCVPYELRAFSEVLVDEARSFHGFQTTRDTNMPWFPPGFPTRSVRPGAPPVARASSDPTSTARALAPVQPVCWWVTRHGNQSPRLDQQGSTKPGKLADIISIQTGITRPLQCTSASRSRCCACRAESSSLVNSLKRPCACSSWVLCAASC